MIKIEWFTRTGNRKENQDNLMVDNKLAFVKEDGEGAFSLDEDEKIHMIAVCDGIGGGSYGNMASLCIAEMISEELKVITEKKIEEIEQWLIEFLDLLNERIVKMSQALGKQVGTTLSMILWKEEKFYAVNIGDSPIYLYRRGKVKILSQEHTVGALYKKNGRNATKQDSSILLHYLGHQHLRGSKMAYIVYGEMKEGDRLFLASDGINEAIGKNMFEEWLKEDEIEIATLEEGLKLMGMSDNCTGILYQPFV